MKTRSQAPYFVAVAGTTDRTRRCAQALLDDPRFGVNMVITPAPKKVGRKSVLTQNPMHTWAQENGIEAVLVQKKIDQDFKQALASHPRPDFLLVVDFGYLVPQWLLEWPQIMPLNIHPSKLPRWRGSSPGQFVLLHGEEKSAVSLIEVTSKFDQGPIFWQKEFTVQPKWTQIEYYQHSFELMAQNLAEVMTKIGQNKITPKKQPTKSPTEIAGRIKKSNAFFAWEEVLQGMRQDKKMAFKIERASKAYSPWPLVWTKIPTPKGEKRMQILSAHQNKKGLLELEIVKIEGMTEKNWNEVKNVVKK